MTTTLTTTETSALDTLFADWQSDDNPSYGWEGETKGKDFVKFWANGSRYDEVKAIVGDNDDRILEALSYMESLG
jgi:hypothetical protein